MLRTLDNPALRTLRRLAGLTVHRTAPSADAAVRLDDEPAPTARATRWDPKRDLRLGWNVFAENRMRAVGPRRASGRTLPALRERWVGAMRDRPFEASRGPSGKRGSRAKAPPVPRERRRNNSCSNGTARLTRSRAKAMARRAQEILEYAQRRMASDSRSLRRRAGRAACDCSSVEAARGREFDRVAVADVRAGAFPRWYSPDAFLYQSPARHDSQGERRRRSRIAHGEVQLLHSS